LWIVLLRDKNKGVNDANFTKTKNKNNYPQQLHETITVKNFSSKTTKKK